MTAIRTYHELSKFKTYRERFEYLLLNGVVAEDTFGFDRYFNQRFYKSNEWRRLRNQIIIRDNACDLGLYGYDIFGKVIVHHMNPICLDDISSCSEFLMNPDYLICVSMDTHNAIHYGDIGYLDAKKQIVRRPNDTKLW